MLTKQQCRDLAPEGYQYGGQWDGFYHFQSGSYREGFYTMACLLEDMEPKNLALMAKMRLSRITGIK